MMDKLWLVLFVALAGFYLSYGLPVRSPPETYPHSPHESSNSWGFDAGWYPAVPALALVVTAVGFLLGCTWCFRHKDCKTNEGADNQLFSTSAPTFHANQQHQLAANYPEPSNNNISEDNNNGPISLREMQNIANNNAAAYIVSENEERNRVNRESVVEFVPLPSGLGAVDPLERCADWFAGESFPRSRLQYLREIGRGWFGRVVEGEIEDEGGTSSVAVRILNQTASLEDKARFLDEARVFRDATHENILPFIAKCLEEDPWIVLFELCPMDLQQYLVTNRPKMAILNDSGVPLRLMSDVTSALAYLHGRGQLYRNVSTTNVLVRGEGLSARAVLGAYVTTEPSHELTAPECRRRPPVYTTSSEIWSVGNLIWEICAWGSAPLHHPPRLPDLPCPYRNHLYQIMQLCWNASPENRPTAAQVQDLINHLYTTHLHSSDSGLDNDDFEDRWQRLKPNTIPKVDEHIAIVHAPSISSTSNFTTSEQELDNPTTTQDTLSLDLDTAVSRSSSIMSDKDPMSGQIKSESLTNLHGSLEDVRNIYLTHNETAALECHQGNISIVDREKELDKSDSSMDPWLKEIIAGSQDDVSYYKDVSDVIKNLDNILNSEKTSSSESSHQASPSRDNLSLDCKKEYSMQSSLVKSPGITNFQNILDGGFDSKDDQYEDEDADNDTVGTLSHSFERHSDTTSQHTLANLTPETPNKELEIVKDIEYASMSTKDLKNDIIAHNNCELPNEIVETVNSELPKLKELCQISLNSVSVLNSENHTNKDCDNIIQENGTTDKKENESKSVEDKETPFEQLLSEVSFVGNQPINGKTVTEVNFSSLGAPNDKENSDTHTMTPVMPHRTIINDVTPSELLIQTEKNMAALDFCLPEIQHTEFKSNLSTVPIESQTFPEENAVDDTKNLDADDIRLPEVLEQIVKTESFISPKHDANAQRELAEAISRIQSVTFASVEDEIPQDIFCEIDTTLTEEKNDTVIDIKDIVHESSKIGEVSKSEESQIHCEDTELVHNAKSEINANNKLCNEQKPRLLSEEAIMENHLEPSSSNTFQETSPQLSCFLVDAENFTNLTQNNSKTAPLKKFTHSTNVNDLVEKVHLGENDVLCKMESDNEEHIAETEEVDVIKGITSDEVSQEENVEQTETIPYKEDIAETETSPEIVQNIVEGKCIEIDKNEQVKFNDSNKTRSDSNKKDNLLKQTNEDTVYMDLINNTSSEILHDNNLDMQVATSCLDGATLQGSFTLINDDSTVYLDLPSRIKETHDFLRAERALSVPNENFDMEKVFSSSTPEGNSIKLEDSQNAMEVIDEARILKLEQRCVDSSPPESPSKSHHTDTYDENSSVVLGPFENNSVGSYHQHRPQGDLVDLPKEELLAFSSNFSEMNLETPSPLRDVNFLKEVPDILPDDLQFDDLESISEVKRDLSEPLPLPDSNSSQDETDSQANAKVAGPSTPPNSPGVILVSDPQPKYLVDIDLNPPNPPAEEINRFLQNEIELNQIELQITSKLAMAENENNMNIEYSGPLVEESMEQDSLFVYEEETVPERFLAGNLGAPDQSRPSLSLDEECVQALRNELELKLPLAQVASIEPQADGEWCTELPPPPELIVNYPGALSPIVEETRQQLSAYENDALWNPATLPDSSESYPEPCNNSTDDVTDISIGNSGVNEATFVLHSRSNSNTYTVDKDQSSKKITMSTDSLNGSPLKLIPKESLSPVDDKTYTKKDNEDTNCERISQVSPFLLSPSTDTTIPENSENATASSTFVKTFVPSDSKFNNTQCLSTATSIDSCCSNDTLYNVEENFDDLAMDPELPPDFDNKDDEFRERRHSYCSTYTVRDDKSDACDTFSPDSISENNYTYTNIARTEIPTITPSADTKSDKSDKKSNDLAYGTLPSYSNCATEYLSGIEDAWKLPPLELIRKSPVQDEVISTPPRITALLQEKPQEDLELKFEPCIKKMDSVEITCLKDNTNPFDKSENIETSSTAEIQDNPEQKSSAPFLTSTPLTDNKEIIDQKSIQNASEICFAITSPDDYDKTLLQTSKKEIEVANTAFIANLLEERTEDENKASYDESLAERALSYSDFEKSASYKPQHNSSSKDNQSAESGISSEDFLKSIRERPQDLSSGISASSLLLANERIFALSLSGIDSIPLSQTDSLETESTQPLVSISPCNPNLNETLIITPQKPDIFVTDLDDEEETDQPHSIIITDLKNFANEPLNRSYDSHINEKLLDTFNSHENTKRLSADFAEEIPTNGTSDLKTELKPLDSVTHVNADFSKNLMPNGSAHTDTTPENITEANCNGNIQVYATVNFLSDAFEELIESNVDGNDSKSIEDPQTQHKTEEMSAGNEIVDISSKTLLADKENLLPNEINGVVTGRKPEENQLQNGVPEKVVTENFLRSEKNFCRSDNYLPLLSDIRFTGPGSEIMSTSFSQDSPTEPESPESEKDKKCDAAADILKEWDSDSDNHSSNSSSGEFIWKDGDGNETAVVPSTQFQHERDGAAAASSGDRGQGSGAPASEGSGDSASGSEGDEVEFVPSSWDCSAAPSKSSLRSLADSEQITPSKKRVVFKRQKYHCVYEYPREVCEVESESPAAFMPDLSTYCEWDPTTAEDAEIGYSQLFGAPNPLDMFTLRSGIAYGADYDEDFFISSSARPFESLGIMSTSSQFFPGKHVKPSLVERDITDDGPNSLTLSPLTTLVQTRTPSLDFTTPDSGVEDITPGSLTSEEDFKKKLPEDIQTWRPADSGSSSESVSPSSPGGEILGGLRHTRDKLKLDLPPSPHIPSPRHNRVFNFVLDKPKRHRYPEERIPEVGTTPLVMTDETPVITTTLPIHKDEEDVEVPEPTFSTFGKCVEKNDEAEQKCIVLDEIPKTAPESDTKEETENHVKVETVKGEGTVLDSGDEDSGIESSKATLERNKTPNVS